VPRPPKLPPSTLPLSAGLCLAGVLLLSSCATLPWPDEPGVPVEISQAANVDAGDAFLTALTEKRRVAGHPAPLVAPRYQADVRTFALDLQSGKISAVTAQHAIQAWGQTAYQRAVDPWIIDCGAGSNMVLPDKLVNQPTSVISYAAAHFRPRSMPAEQCAILAVSLTGNQPVQLTP
jgi:hypothetical protein